MRKDAAAAGEAEGPAERCIRQRPLAAAAQLRGPPAARPADLWAVLVGLVAGPEQRLVVGAGAVMQAVVGAQPVAALMEAVVVGAARDLAQEPPVE